MKHLLSLLVALLSCACVSARGYFGTPSTFAQPDGDSVTVWLYGNDYYIHAESEEGYTLIKDAEDGYICYALLTADSSEYASSGIRYRGGVAPQAVAMIAQPHLRISSEALAQKIAATKEVLGVGDDREKPTLRSATAQPDTIFGVTVLIDFPDCKFPFSVKELDQFLNGEGSINGNARSIKEYFQWISNGKLTYINYLPSEPFTTPEKKSYYAPEDATTYTISRLSSYIVDALKGYTKEKDGFDVSDLSRGSRCFKAVNIMYAGSCPNQWATGLWPHQGSMYISFPAGSALGNDVFLGMSQPYQLCYCASDLSMGTFIHESFHLLLDAPDFYSFDGHAGNTAEKYNVADEFTVQTKKNPPIPNPWIMESAGWLDNKIELNDLAEGTKVDLSYGPGNIAVYHNTNNPDPMRERFYVEVRDHYYYNGRIVNTPGLYIWHVYEPGDNKYKESIDQLDCRPASYTNPFWSAASPSKVFSDESEPDAKWVNGDVSDIYLCHFSKAGLEMSFCYGPCDDEEEESGDGNDKGDKDDKDDKDDENPNVQYEPLNLTNRDSLPNGVVGEAYYAKLNGVGGDGKYSIQWKDGLPAGLSLNSDLEIVGTPTTAGSKMLKMYVCDGTGAKTEVWLKLTILPDQSTLADAVDSEPLLSLFSQNGLITIRAVRESLRGVIYSLQGIRMDEFSLERGEERSFGTHYPSGLYIVDVEGRRYVLGKR